MKIKLSCVEWVIKCFFFLFFCFHMLEWSFCESSYRKTILGMLSPVPPFHFCSFIMDGKAEYPALKMCSVNGAIASYPCPFSMASALSLTQVCDFLTHQKISTHLSSNYLPRQIFLNEPHCRRFLSYFHALVLENRFHRRFPNPDTVQI